MTLTGFAAVGSPRGALDTEYAPGVCNIGPDEIARRRRAGYVGALVTIAPFVVRRVFHIAGAGAVIGVAAGIIAVLLPV